MGSGDTTSEQQPPMLCSELDSSLLLGNQRVTPGVCVASVAGVGGGKRQSQHVPVPHIQSPASILSSRFSDNVSLGPETIK